MKSLRERSQRKEDEVDSEGSWAISYADMVTLLLGFFILFFTVDTDQQRAESLMESLKMTLNSMDVRAPSSVTEGGHGGAIGAAPLPVPEVDLNIEGVDLNLVDFNEKLIVDFVGISFFPSGEIRLTREGEKALSAFTKKYMPYAGQYILQVQAFTDHRPVVPDSRRKFSDNLELSALRSVAAMRILQNSGVPLHRMRLSGLGEITLSEQYLRKSSGDAAATLDLARKVILVIQPEPPQRETADVG